MPREVLVTGSFARSATGEPVGGWISFTPCRLWVIQEKVAWACLAPTLPLDSHGGFSALLTPTDTDAIGFCYEVACPAGTFSIEVPWDEIGHSLGDLVDEHRVRPRPQD